MRLSLLAQLRVPPPLSEAGENTPASGCCSRLGAGAGGAAGPRAGVGVAQATRLSSSVSGARDGPGSHSHQPLQLSSRQQRASRLLAQPSCDQAHPEPVLG